MNQWKVMGDIHVYIKNEYIIELTFHMSEKVTDYPVLGWDNWPSIWGNIWWELIYTLSLSSRHFYTLSHLNFILTLWGTRITTHFTNERNWASERWRKCSQVTQLLRTRARGQVLLPQGLYAPTPYGISINSLP